MAQHNSEHSSHDGAPHQMLGTGALLTQDADVGLGHIVDTKTVLVILALLIVLTFVTVAASHYNFGALNFVVAIGIATLKAAIVATYFMHLKFEGRVIWMYVAYPIILIAILISSTVSDYATREQAKPMFVKELARDFVQPVPAHGDTHSQEPHTTESHEVPAAHH